MKGKKRNLNFSSSLLLGFIYYLDFLSFSWIYSVFEFNNNCLLADLEDVVGHNEDDNESIMDSVSADARLCMYPNVDALSKFMPY